MRCDKIWTKARIATMGSGRVLDDGVVASRDGCIAYVGSTTEAPKLDAPEIIDCEGRWITPGLIDCHTHIVYAGDRAHEFELRLGGASYEEIALAGGGIASTVRETRRASQIELVNTSLPRVDALLSEGVTTIEIKSGYGLTLPDELKMLKTARTLGQQRSVNVVTAFLGAHAVPPEFAGDPDEYVDLVCEVMIPSVAAKGLADIVDAFCEGIGFTSQQVARIFDAAKAQGLPIKLHAEQLSNLHGAELAAQRGALSVDHLEHLDERGVAALAEHGTVATLLPGAFYFVRETKLPPVNELRAAGVPMAIATDCNPGTSPLTSLLLAMNMAATLFRLTVDECLAGVTCHAARALGLGNQIGTLEIGKSCDLAIWDIGRPADLVYRMGFNPLHARVWRGQ